MTKKNLQIHSENILPIIKKWLYSEKDIFVRELVSNSCDAIHKLQIMRDKSDVDVSDAEFRIDIIIDKENKTLKFIDTGIGMDADEVERYIAQIAFSGAEDFVEKYKSNQESDQIIGHFGLGFYSSYMVAKKVEINTLSYKPNSKPAFWSCDGSSEYELTEGSRTTRGTEITLYLNDENEEFLEESHLKKILKEYCSFLSYPVFLGEQRINEKEPLWIKNPSECTEEEYLEFYRHLYLMEEDPLFWMHLNVDYPFHLKGILYFPKMQRDFDINKNHVKLYCNRVYVSDNCKDVIPRYLTMLKGVIDSPDIPLNVSRSYLQVDKTVRQLANHISKKVSDSLTTLFRTDYDRFIKCWQDISLVIKLGAIEDEKFYEKIKDVLIWKTLDNNWTTAQDYLERNREKTQDKIIYTIHEDDRSHFIEMFRKKNIEILCIHGPLDTHLMHFLESKMAPARFQRVDGAIEEVLLDKEKENTALDAEGKSEAVKLADYFKSKLLKPNIEVEAKSLLSDSLPGFLMIDEGQRRMRDYMRTLNPEKGNEMEDLFSKNTFVINTNSPLIHSIMKLEETDSELATALVNQIYDLSLLSQKELSPKALHDFVANNTKVLERLSEKASNR